MSDAAHIVIVEPVDAGWSVQVGGADNPMVFARAQAAEQAGRALAMRLAEVGRAVQLELRLHGGAVVSRFICFAAPEEVSATRGSRPRPRA